MPEMTTIDYMTEMTADPEEEVQHLRERVRKLTRDKSHLQMVNSLMNKVSAVQGLNNMVTILLSNILDVIGGTNIILYYLVDDELFSADVFGTRSRIDSIDDELVSKVLEFRVPIEIEHDFSDTRMLTPEFTKAYTWVFPLLVGTELIGLIKLENLHISTRELYNQQPALFSFVANVLKNELQGQSRLKIANDRLRELNETLQLEIIERQQTEEELRQARDRLEVRVRERTTELQDANEKLRQELDERKRAQELLNSYAEEVRDLYNRAPCGYHSLDSDGLFIRMNDTELQWLGYQRDEIVGKKHFTDLISERTMPVFQENFPRFKAQGWIKDLEFEMIRKDGSSLPVLLSATVVCDETGNFLMSRSTVYDITEQKRVRAIEHLLSAVVQSSDDAIIAKDLNGVILSWNRGAERIYGYPADEVIGRNISLLYPPCHEDEYAGFLAALKRREHIEHYVTSRQCKDGRQIPVSLSISPIMDANGDIVGASSIARDITTQVHTAEEVLRLNRELEERVSIRTSDLDQKRSELEESQRALMNIVDDLNLKTLELEEANSRLMELDQLKSMFIASMSHELRTPLNSIIGFSSILHDEWLGPVNPEQKENLSTIQRSGKHLLSLINDVIDVSKIEAGRIEARFEEFDLYELLTEAIQYVDKDLRDKRLELHLNIDHHQLCTDRRRLLQCVINLLTNAVKFTEQGSVMVSVSVSGVESSDGHKRSGVPCPRILIAVEDSGIGISEEDLPRLFKPFVRLDSPLKITSPGTGLGLYLTRKLVEEVLHGDILCTSTLGKGSTFTLSIPERTDEKGSGSRG